ncbi:MAG TPA: hypothetical protein VFM68_04495 [Candidatus Saccharimonadales bacterium]|nr:hypothetical protein [Candidatus Saccharimonadales bacterium]
MARDDLRELAEDSAKNAQQAAMNVAELTLKLRDRRAKELYTSEVDVAFRERIDGLASRRLSLSDVLSFNTDRRKATTLRVALVALDASRAALELIEQSIPVIEEADRFLKKHNKQ